MVEEILREKIYRCLHREVPHNVTQQNRVFRYSTTKANDDGDEKLNTLHISQDLVVRTKSHQRLVLGSGGKTLERIKTTALKDLEDIFDCNVDLELNVRLTKSMQDVPLESESMGALSRLLD
jgi:GTP-binding protein Era